MVSLIQPRVSRAGQNFLTGQNLGRTQALQDQERQTNVTAGELASQGDFKGARDTFFKGGQFDKGLATQQAITKMSNDRLAQVKFVQDQFARIAPTIETPEQFEIAKKRFQDQGLPVPQGLTFDQLPQVRQQALSTKEQIDVELKRRGLDIQEGKLRAAAAGSERERRTEDTKAAADLRKEFTKVSKEFRDISDGLSRVQAGAEIATGPGDISLLIGFMKILDPGSVVRETEFATAENAQGVPDRIRSLFNRIQNGERLTPESRQEFVDAAEQLASQKLAEQERVIATFRSEAERAGIDPERVIVDFGSGRFGDRAQDTPSPQAGSTVDDLSGVPDGTPVVNEETGERGIVRGGQFVPLSEIGSPPTGAAR